MSSSSSDPAASEKVFRLGIAMAGAVSAGAYTAGVIDYLLQTLDAWEKQKEKNRQIEREFGSKDVSKGYDPSVPMHEVRIEVIGGASAGGITAALTLLTLLEGFEPGSAERPNKLYDAWVNLNDQAGSSTLEQMLSDSDLDRIHKKIPSLLNADPIDAIGQKALPLRDLASLPNYISDELEVILTLTSLRGIPLAVNFYDKVKVKDPESRPAPAHKMNLHKAVAHFRLGDGQGFPPHVFPLRPDNEADRQQLVDFAISSGAFPLGLRPRLFRNTPLSYIQAMTNRMFRSDNPNQAFFDVLTNSDPFEFVAVDGGTINNEPFGEIIDVLEEKCRVDGSDYAVIMIDPFPNFGEEEEEVRIEGLPPVMEQVPGILGAIRGQAMMKESEVARGFSGDFTRRMIFPKRGDDPFAISCGALDGFGGFFNRSFRQHDFQLGRKNCQGFLRKYLSVKLEDTDRVQLFADWSESDAKHQRFFVPDKYGRGGYYPIIPDVRAQPGADDPTKVPLPERTPIPVKEILALQPAIQDRIKSMLILGQEGVFASKPQKEPSPERRWAENTVNSTFGLKGQVSGFLRLLINLGRRLWRSFLADRVARSVSYMLLKQILADFRRRGLVE